MWSLANGARRCEAGVAALPVRAASIPIWLLSAWVWGLDTHELSQMVIGCRTVLSQCFLAHVQEVKSRHRLHLTYK